MPYRNNLFDRLSTNYIKYRHPKKLVLRRVCQILAQYQTSGIRLLDLGCGTGSYLYAIPSSLGISLYGLDLSFPMLTASSAVINSAYLVNSDFRKGLPFQAESFQIVLGVDVFHFADSIPSLLNEINRILLKGGLFIATLHTPDDIKRQTLSKYFPGTAKIEVPQSKKLLNIKEAAIKNGFLHIATHCDIERFRATKEFLALFEFKCASALHMISQYEFSTGIGKLRIDFANKELIGIESHTTYVFRRA